jgi:riboflavin kinase/FMN adenylyltransferase
MLLLRQLDRIDGRFDLPVLTLGNFDGVHRGHQEILHRVVSTARAIGGTAVALTFEPHPAAVLNPSSAPPLLTDWRSRIERIAAMGVDVVIVQRFTRAFSEIPAADFVRRFLVAGLAVHKVIVGHRVSFGHKREGHAATLRHLGTEHGFAVEIVGPVDVEGFTVSSSAVRRAVREGDLQRAWACLGRPASVSGRVVHGHHRGRGLGFPTANLRVANMVLPPDGVYAVWTQRRSGSRGGVANLGRNPTFGNTARSLEVHLFDLDEDLYGQRVEVGFVRRLRGETRFASVDALAAQIAQDAAAARRALHDAGWS